MNSLIPKRNGSKAVSRDIRNNIERILGTYVRKVIAIESKPRVKIYVKLKQNLPFPKIMALHRNYKIIYLSVEDDMLIVGANPKPKKKSTPHLLRHNKEDTRIRPLPAMREMTMLQNPYCMTLVCL